MAKKDKDNEGLKVSMTVNGKDFPLPNDLQEQLNIDEETAERNYLIIEAALSDDICNYDFEVTSGIHRGQKNKVKATKVCEEDLRFAFGSLNVHLAVIDDVFKHNQIEIDDIGEYHTHDLSSMYHVSGFKIRGGIDDESVILVGSKFISSGGRIDIVTPKIPLDQSSSYKFSDELANAIARARHEVELYHEGKFQVDEEEDDEEHHNPKQLTINDAFTQTDNFSDFEKAKVE